MFTVSWLSCLSCLVLLAWTLGQVYTVSNIQIDSEDGRQHFIELNLKKVDVEDIGSCLTNNCNQNGHDFTLGSIYDHATPSPPTFTLLFTPGDIIIQCDSETNVPLPFGICSSGRNRGTSVCNSEACSMEDVEDLAEIMEEHNLIPMRTGDADLDHRIAVAIVLLNIGNLDKAIAEFTYVLAAHPAAGAAYFGRGVALARKGQQNVSAAQQALSDLSRVIQLDSSHTRPDIFIHRAQLLLRMQNQHGARSDVTLALTLREQPQVYFLRGVISLLMENFDDAEADFRKNLQSPDAKIRSLSHFHLGLTLFYRGKVRNAVEVFKEVLKENPSHVEAALSLAQGFKELGNTRAALNRFNQTLQLQSDHVMLYNLRGNMMYDSGDLRSALLDFERCTQLDSNNANCQYLQAACKIMLGQFYDGVKDTTKLMITDSPAMKASPEYMKAHYLREYARYIHNRLDSPISSIRPDVDFSPEYLNHWIKLKRFDFTNYKEQPGLHPDIRDLSQLSDTPPKMKTLVCWAQTLGQLSQVSTDGVVPNKRVSLSVGLSSIHIAQHLEVKWKELKNKTSSHKQVIHDWRELFDVAVYYQRLATIDQPLLWVDSLPDYTTKGGYRLHFPFVRGSTINPKVTSYFELAFKLAKTMLEHYSGDGAVVYPQLKEDISKATTCPDLLDIAKRRKINQYGFLVSTQVPSLHRAKDDYRLDGGVLVLSRDLSQRVIFALNIANTPDRTSAYAAELNHLMTLLQEEIKKGGSARTLDVDSIISHILSVMYYFYNLVPLSTGSSAVAYSVVMGMLLSVGWQITGRIPHGRMLDLEAMLAGGPDAFVLVVKSWMSVRKASVPLSDLPRIWEVLPTVGSVLEILAVNSTVC